MFTEPEPSLRKHGLLQARMRLSQSRRGGSGEGRTGSRGSRGRGGTGSREAQGEAQGAGGGVGRGGACERR